MAGSIAQIVADGRTRKTDSINGYQDQALPEFTISGINRAMFTVWCRVRSSFRHSFRRHPPQRHQAAPPTRASNADPSSVKIWMNTATSIIMFGTTPVAPCRGWTRVSTRDHRRQHQSQSYCSLWSGRLPLLVSSCLYGTNCCWTSSARRQSIGVARTQPAKARMPCLAL